MPDPNRFQTHSTPPRSTLKDSCRCRGDKKCTTARNRYSLAHARWEGDLDMTGNAAHVDTIRARGGSPSVDAGEQLHQLAFAQAGVIGDRACAPIDAESGKVASAESVRLFPNLLRCKAEFVTHQRKVGTCRWSKSRCRPANQSPLMTAMWPSVIGAFPPAGETSTDRLKTSRSINTIPMSKAQTPAGIATPSGRRHSAQRCLRRSARRRRFHPDRSWMCSLSPS